MASTLIIESEIKHITRHEHLKPARIFWAVKITTNKLVINMIA